MRGRGLKWYSADWREKLWLKYDAWSVVSKNMLKRGVHKFDDLSAWRKHEQ